jgi:DNA-directed RNA polymerase specialized sigma24 family protein
VLVSTDTDLIQRAAEGDREAFEYVYSQCFPPIWSLASRTAAGRVSAEALARRILQQAFAELDDYDGQVPFAAWLLSVAHRVARTHAPHPTRPSTSPRRTRLA